jgi:glycosyltransferase involved in cell wall biosynthesis
MKIAILGTRGIPNYYGGFEQYAELLSVFLVKSGFEVTVYNSHNHPYRESNYKGVRIIHIFDPEKSIGTAGQFLYDLGCIRDIRKRNFDIVYQLGYTSSAIFNFLLPKKSMIVTNMDGLEWMRSKYSKKVQRFLMYSEKLAVKYADHLIADSLGIKAYLDDKYGCDSFYSAYTAEIPQSYDTAHLQTYNLVPGKYNLLIARMEPENNVAMIIEAHAAMPDTILAVVGNTYTPFGKAIRAQYENCSNILFLEAIYDKSVINSMRHFSYRYLHGHSVGGTNPSLLEAMACQCNILAHDNIFNRSVLGEDARYFKDVASLQEHLATDPASFFEAARQANLKKIEFEFSENQMFEILKERLIAWQKGNNS